MDIKTRIVQLMVVGKGQKTQLVGELHPGALGIRIGNRQKRGVDLLLGIHGGGLFQDLGAELSAADQTNVDPEGVRYPFPVLLNV